MTAMKFVIAVVKPFKLDNVVDALKGAGVQSMTAVEVKNFVQNGATEIYRGAKYTVNFLPMIRIEAVVADDQVATVTAAVAAAAETGRAGDVRLFVIDVEDVLRPHASEESGITPHRGTGVASRQAA